MQNGAKAHARIPMRTMRLAGGDSRVYAKCRCGWVVTWPRTQAQAADAYRGHLAQAEAIERAEAE